MKHLILFITIMNLTSTGCMKSQIKDTLMAPEVSDHIRGIAILSTNFEDKKFADCIKSHLEKKIPKFKFVPGNEFRDTLFPWFDSETLPYSSVELSTVLNKKIVRECIETIGVDILIYVHGDTNQSEFEGFVGGGYGGAAAGYVIAERKTHIWTNVWDIKNIIRLGDTAIDYQGTIHMPIVGLPIPIPVFTESSACIETANKITNCLKSYNLHNE